MDDDEDDEDERMPNGDLSRDLRQDDDDLRDPVNVRSSSLEWVDVTICVVGAADTGREEWETAESAEESEGWPGKHSRWPGNDDQTMRILQLNICIPGWDHHGQDPQREREAGQRQVQDVERGEEGQHQEKSGSVREHVNNSRSPSFNIGEDLAFTMTHNDLILSAMISSNGRNDGDSISWGTFTIVTINDQSTTAFKWNQIFTPESF